MDKFNKSLIVSFVDKMKMEEFIKWLEIPATDEDLYCAYEYWKDKDIIKSDLIYEKYKKQLTPKRVSDD